MTPTISLLIPVYKNHDYAIACVRSALKYANEFVEIIIVDDCPDDPLYAVWPVVTELSNKIKYEVNFVNIGRSQNYNLLIKKAIGDFYLMLDGDDFLNDNINFVELKKILSNNRDINILAGHCIEFDQKGVIRRAGYNENTGRVSGIEFYKNLTSAPRVLPHSASIVRRREVLKVGGYPTSYISSDIALFRKLSISGDIYFINMLISCWRYHGHNVSRSSDATALVNNINHILDPLYYAYLNKDLSKLYMSIHTAILINRYIIGCCHQYIASDSILTLLRLYRLVFNKYKSNYPVLIGTLISIAKLAILLAIRKILSKKRFRKLMSARGNYLYRDSVES